MECKELKKGYGRQAYRRGIPELYQAVVNHNNKLVGFITGTDPIEIKKKTYALGYKTIGKMF